MSTPSGYTPYHPRWYRRRVSVWWWLEKAAYAKFVLRELTSVAVAFFAVELLWKVRALGRGPEAYALFLTDMQTPLFLALNAVAFLLVMFHAVTWFNLAPKAMVVRVDGRRVPDWTIQAMNYAVWLVLSAAALWFIRRS
jgi:fumarate reductase subunit C